MARPTNYNQEVLDQSWEYVNGGWDQDGAVIPSLVGLCRVINRGKSTLYDWAKDPEKKFSDIIEAINETQEEILAKNGLTGDFNSTITKLLMTKHGYSDKQEVVQDTYLKVEGLSDEELERIASGSD